MVVRLWIWFYLAGSALGLIAIILRHYREIIRGKYYKWRFPEKVVGVVMHYPGTHLYKKFWRLIPDSSEFRIDGKTFFFSEKAIIKENECYAQPKADKFMIKVEGKEYELYDQYLIQGRGKTWPEIHYQDNCPAPIDFQNIEKGQIRITAKDYQTISDNNILSKLLTLTGQNSMIMFLMVLQFVTLAVVGFLLAKNMGWIK